ncbi:hypothetical protein M2322_004615 [Rhodoblastus acidophilus]|uniref:GvpL/GvpF family gas vesicle protein n=1 Tax=Rhodoblastus acidophilus TaxID=1074 RepID=UPI00222429FB|nr:GvpL/GvpF family gas vesicle protein [Rhodoblastus acidophilus]MCW2319046.1 hypothetical protein [Rhodoblastus acidophilus]
MAAHAYIYAALRAEDVRAVDLPAVANLEARPACLVRGPVALMTSPIAEPEILPSRRNMLAHTKILEELTRDLPILPFRFGMIARDIDAVEALLASRAEKMRATLDDLADKIEVGLRLTFREDKVFQRLAADHPELRQRSESLARRSGAEAHNGKIALGRDVNERLAQRRAALATEVSRRLEGFAERRVEHDMREDMAVYHAALLVRRAREPDLFAEIGRIEAEIGDHVAMTYVSPAPPYHFVSLQIDARVA